jgi:hypothetical protein
MLVLVSELFLRVLLYFFQRDCAGGSADLGCGSPPIDEPRDVTSPPPRSSCHCIEYLSRIADLEGRLSLMKRQAKTAMNQASKSYGLMKQVSILEDKVSVLVMSTHASVLVDSVGPPSVEVCRTAASFP